MPFFVKKPKKIEAVLNVPENINLVRLLAGDRVIHHLGDGNLGIPTLEGMMIANRGDWLIKGIHGELYPCKPDIFADSYDPVSE